MPQTPLKEAFAPLGWEGIEGVFSLVFGSLYF